MLCNFTSITFAFGLLYSPLTMCDFKNSFSICFDDLIFDFALYTVYKFRFLFYYLK